MSQSEQKTDDAVAMIGIAKSFGGVAALEHVDFSVWKGEIHALLGGNGAGKSTVLKMLSGVHKPDKGEIWINGVKLVRRVGAFRIDLVKVPRFGGKGDSEPPRVGSNLRLIRT